MFIFQKRRLCIQSYMIGVPDSTFFSSKCIVNELKAISAVLSEKVPNHGGGGGGGGQCWLIQNVAAESREHLKPRFFGEDTAAAAGWHTGLAHGSARRGSAASTPASRTRIPPEIFIWDRNRTGTVTVSSTPAAIRISEAVERKSRSNLSLIDVENYDKHHMHWVNLTACSQRINKWVWTFRC